MNMTTKTTKDQITEIIRIAYKQGIILPPKDNDYPLMQLPDVEKCLALALDSIEMLKARNWYKERIAKETKQRT